MKDDKYPILTAFVNELKRIFRDPGVAVIFIVATLVYPLLYKAIYWNEQIDLPSDTIYQYGLDITPANA